MSRLSTSANGRRLAAAVATVDRRTHLDHDARAFDLRDATRCSHELVGATRDEHRRRRARRAKRPARAVAGPACARFVGHWRDPRSCRRRHARNRQQKFAASGPDRRSQYREAQMPSLAPRRPPARCRPTELECITSRCWSRRSGSPRRCRARRPGTRTRTGSTSPDLVDGPKRHVAGRSSFCERAGRRDRVARHQHDRRVFT